MIIEEATSLEEDSIFYSNELNTAYNSILSNIEEFIDKSTIPPTLKIAKMRSIQQVVESIFSPNKDFTLEKIYASINSMRSQIETYQKKEQKYIQTIEDLQFHLKESELQKQRIAPKQYELADKNDNNDNNDMNEVNDNDDSKGLIKRLKRKIKNNENTFNLKEIKYLCKITEQSHQIKILQKKIIPVYDEKEIRKAKLFPHLYKNNIEGRIKHSRDNFSKSNSRNKLKTLIISSSLNPYLNHKNPFNIEHNDDKDKGLQTEISHRTKSITTNIITPSILSVVKSTDNLSNYNYYQKNRRMKQSQNHKLKNNIMEISNIINIHNKTGRFKIIKNLFKQPTLTYYDSIKKV